MSFDLEAEVLSEEDCLALLRTWELGRIAFDVDGRVEIFPVNYGMEGSIIVFWTSSGTKLDEVPKRAVAFEVDSWEPESSIGWSVVARGWAEEVTTSIGRVAEHLRWVPVHPVAPGERRHWIGIKPADITGRRFHVRRRSSRSPLRSECEGEVRQLCVPLRDEARVQRSLRDEHRAVRLAQDLVRETSM
jgi:nitroimidazol reductase NimA-like FMN-containing flavoprotein (pyridoxamine 5'-phosphate oxidase superfamily)